MDFNPSRVLRIGSLVLVLASASAAVATAQVADADGTTPLHWAVRRDDLAAADTLIKAGADVKAANRYGVTPIALASTIGNAAMIRRLLDAGADPNAATPNGETALMTAARTGKIDAVQLLLDRGAMVDAKDTVRAQTALMWAVIEKHTDDRHAAAVAGCRRQCPNDGDDTQGRVRAGASRRRSGNGHHPAAGPADGEWRDDAAAVCDSRRQPGMTGCWSNRGADILKSSGNHTSPLLIALLNEQVAPRHGTARERAPTRTPRTTTTAPLVCRDRHSKFQPREIHRPPDRRPRPAALDQGPARQGSESKSRTDTIPVRGLMQVSANWANFDGQTPFLRAALSGDVTLMRLLLEHGADPNLGTNDGATAADGGGGHQLGGRRRPSADSEQEYLDAAQLCLERGNDVNAVNSQGFTAMHGAANRGFDAMITAAGRARGEARREGQAGRTPMTFAEGVFLAVQPPVREAEARSRCCSSCWAKHDARASACARRDIVKRSMSRRRVRGRRRCCSDSPDSCPLSRRRRASSRCRSDGRRERFSTSTASPATATRRRPAGSRWPGSTSSIPPPTPRSGRKSIAEAARRPDAAGRRAAPDRAALEGVRGCTIETSIDRAAAANPNPGATSLHRLNRDRVRQRHPRPAGASTSRRPRCCRRTIRRKASTTSRTCSARRRR